MSESLLEKINPLSLPSIPIEQRRGLPSCSAIYFAISADDEVLYIGRSVNLAQRWISHHRYSEFEEMGDIRIAWLEVNDPELLPVIEAALVDWFASPLNIAPIQRRQPTLIQGSVLNRIKQFLDSRPDPVSGTEYTSPYRFWQDTGIGRDTAYRMYNDPTYIPTSKALNKICSAYKIQPGTFLIWEPDDEPQTAIAGSEKSEESEQGQEPNVGSCSKGRKRTRSFLTVIPEVPESA